MFNLVDISKSFGARDLFTGVHWALDRFQRTGLVGPNGSGKTTLLKIIAGDMLPDGGQVQRTRGATLGYLPQEVGELEGTSTFDVVLSGQADLLAMREELGSLAARLADDPDGSLHKRYGELQAQVELRDGYALEARAQEILAGMGFRPEQLEVAPHTLSGGWRVRLLLSRLLLQSPNLLLLDEPTNHLDLESLRWLENFLVNYPGNIVFVSHDRAFLNRVVTGVAVLDRAGVRLFPGNYDDFTRQIEAERSLLEKQAEKQAREIAKTEAFIERFRYKATKAKQVQSRVKALEKMDRIELHEDRSRLKFTLPDPPRSEHVVAELEHVAKAYGDHVVYRDLNFKAYRGDTVALVGPNGAGKSTLLKILAGVIDFDEGERCLGSKVTLAYFAQHQAEALTLTNSVYQEMLTVSGDASQTEIRSLLGAFYFRNDDVDKPVSVLSGGEKNRLALAKILIRPPNFLVMDEPTNHLDLDSRAALEEALSAYTGCLIFISHDRYFINRLASKIIHIEDGNLTEYIGTFDAYEARRAGELEALAPDSDDGQNAAPPPASSKKERRRILAESRKRRKAATGDLRKRVEASEGRIAELEGAVGEIEAKLADPTTYNDASAASQLAQQLGEQRAALEAEMERWTVDQMELEELDAQFDAEEAELLGDGT